MEPETEFNDKISQFPRNSSTKEMRETVIESFLPPGKTEHPVIQLILEQIFSSQGEFTLQREERYGGDLHFQTPEEFLEAWENEEIHPQDVKENVERYLEKRK